MKDVVTRLDAILDELKAINAKLDKIQERPFKPNPEPGRNHLLGRLVGTRKP
jgi:hypothetical protein